jgi:hypothetical protein
MRELVVLVRYCLYRCYFLYLNAGPGTDADTNADTNADTDTNANADADANTGTNASRSSVFLLANWFRNLVLLTFRYLSYSRCMFDGMCSRWIYCHCWS